jgi:hypothetical protein
MFHVLSRRSLRGDSIISWSKGNFNSKLTLLPLTSKHLPPFLLPSYLHPSPRDNFFWGTTMGSKTKSSDSSAVADEIINTVRASDNGKSMELKSLRKAVLIATKHLSDKEGDIDKSTKKLFKAAVQSLENGELHLQKSCHIYDLYLQSTHVICLDW